MKSKDNDACPLRSQGNSQCDAPGERAVPVKVPALLNSLPRWVLSSKGPTRSFLQSILNNPEKDYLSTSADRSVWPMPLPYPEVFKAGGQKLLNAPLKRLVCLQVVVLNWFCLDRPATAPGFLAAAAGVKLNSRQWTAVNMVEHLSTHGNTPELVDASMMGRAAVKMEDGLVALSRAAAFNFNLMVPISVRSKLLRPLNLE